MAAWVLPTDQLSLPCQVREHSVSDTGSLGELWPLPGCCGDGGAVTLGLPHGRLGKSRCIRRFSAGDVVMIQPQNCPEDVQQFCQLLRLDPDRRFVLKPTEPGRSYPLLLSVPAGMRQPLSPAWPSAFPLL